MPQATKPPKPPLPSSNPAAPPGSFAAHLRGPAPGLGRLFASLAYEVLLLAAILLMETGAFLALAHNLPPALQRPLLQLWLFAWTLAYFLYCWLRGGQTLAMRTWRIQLVGHTGESVSLRQGMGLGVA
jgi:uncharacterized RDD family membrane protein YckC